MQILVEQALEGIENLIRKAIDYGERVMGGLYDEIDEAIACDNIELACLSIIALLEQYPHTHNTLREEATSLLKSVKENPLKTTVLNGEPYLVWPFKARDIVDIFKNLHVKQQKDVVQEISPLLDVIRNSEYFITNPKVFGKVPDSEGDVHLRIEGLLKCLYTEVEHKPRIPKPIKSFEPDTGIRSLRTLIEYKFIKTVEGGKKILEQILADIGGYQTDDYDKFVFVIYETNRVFPLRDWERAIEGSRPPNQIKIVVIKGVDSDHTITSKQSKS
ncbi:hypothetical protein ES703_31734 [subsurface metagenome]